MSRIHLGLILALIAAPLSAQSEGQVTAEEAVQEAKDTYGPLAPQPEPPDCEQPKPDEIVVCARLEEQSQFRVRSDKKAEDDYARATMNKGNPKTPNVDGIGIFQGPATVGDLCIPGLQKCPPPPAYIIDFDALPVAPPGSDADRVGRGLAPRGDDGVAPPSPAVPAPTKEDATPAAPDGDGPALPPGTVPLEIVTAEPG
jgi:hypothetical protein